MGKRFYLFVIISMTLLAAFGVWTMVDSAIAYRSQPRVESDARQQETLSYAMPLYSERM